MKNTLLYSLLIAKLLLLMTAGCKTNPPVTPLEPVFDYGKIFVTSNIDGAEIFLDDQNTGKTTPDTIQAVVGLRTVKLVKDGYKTSTIEVTVLKDQTSFAELELEAVTVTKMVLLEDFANVSCVPCVTTNKITHSLAASYGAKLHIVKFPTNFPKPTDLFYLSAKPDCDARISFYNIITAPTVIIDGVTRPVPSDSVAIKSAIEGALLEDPEFDLTVTQSLTGTDINISVTVIPINTVGLNAGDFTLYTAVVEKRIETTEPPGSNGETIFYDVLRKMLPASGGEVLLNGNENTSVQYNRSTSIKPEWNLNEITTIVYIQNKTTKKVIQAASAG